jgi:SPP1 gp7 family putative phage head morphogenesis protein
MRKKPPLTNRKRKWAENRGVVLRGNTLHYNAGQQAQYVRNLRKLTVEMTKTCKKEVLKLFSSEISDEFFEQQKQNAAMDASISSMAKRLMKALTDRFTQLFSKHATRLAESMVNGAAKTGQANLHSSLKQLSGGLSLKTGIVPKGMEEVAKASVAENVALIVSIPEQYLKNITGAVMRSITTGRGLADLVPAISKFNGQVQDRAKNIALDQTRKAYNSINKERLISIGVKQFEWIHSGGGQTPRESHLKIDGHVFEFENLEAQQAKLGVPVEDRGIPGHPINCRCTMKPVIDFDDSD